MEFVQTDEIINRNYFMTSEEFLELIKEQINLENKKKINVDKSIFSDFKSFEEYSFTLEKNNRSVNNSNNSSLISNFSNKINNERSNNFDQNYLGSYNNTIDYEECDIYLGKNIIILYVMLMNLLIICKYKNFDKRRNYFLLEKIIEFVYEKLELNDAKNEIEEINRCNLNEYLLNKFIEYSKDDDYYYLLDENLNRKKIKLYLNNEFKNLVHSNENNNFFDLTKISDFFRYQKLKKSLNKNNNNDINLNNDILNNEERIRIRPINIIENQNFICINSRNNLRISNSLNESQRNSLNDLNNLNEENNSYLNNNQIVNENELFINRSLNQEENLDPTNTQFNQNNEIRQSQRNENNNYYSFSQNIGNNERNNYNYNNNNNNNQNFRNFGYNGLNLNPFKNNFFPNFYYPYPFYNNPNNVKRYFNVVDNYNNNANFYSNLNRNFNIIRPDDRIKKTIIKYEF